MSAQATTRLILVRHGETVANREFRYVGVRDDALSERGVLQAEQLAEALTTLSIAAVYSSPLQRAYRTAEPIAARHTLAVQSADALIEGNFGMWEGMSRAEVLARSEEDRQNVLAWERDPGVVPPQGESLAMVQERVLTFIALLSQEYAERTVVLVSHVGPIKVLLSAALEAPLLSVFRLFLDPATISVVDWRSDRSLVRLLNSHIHLGWENARWMKI